MACQEHTIWDHHRQETNKPLSNHGRRPSRKYRRGVQFQLVICLVGSRQEYSSERRGVDAPLGKGEHHLGGSQGKQGHHAHVVAVDLGHLKRGCPNHKQRKPLTRMPCFQESSSRAARWNNPSIQEPMEIFNTTLQDTACVLAILSREDCF